MFIDTHCHIGLEDSYGYVKRSIESNVKVLMCASEDYKSSLDSIKLSNMYTEIFSVVGVHPEHAKEFSISDIDKFRELLKEKKVVGIGEIGLDYYYSKEDRDRQLSMFRCFLDLAKEYDMPVVIHTRNATEDTLSILKEYKVKGIIHCFSGSLEVAREYIKLGYKLGIGGVITFKNSKLKEVIKEIGLNNIVLETDSPFLSPEPYRGKVNESKNIPVISKFIADYLGSDINYVMEVTSRNAKEVFNIM